MFSSCTFDGEGLSKSDWLRYLGSIRVVIVLVRCYVDKAGLDRFFA